MSGLTQTVNCLKGVGPKRAQQLQSVGIWTVEDALYTFPFRYEDRTKIYTWNELEDNTAVTIAGRVVQVYQVRLGGKLMTKARVAIEGGVISLLWFNQPYVMQKVKEGVLLAAYGRYHVKKERQLAVAEYQVGEGNALAEFFGIIPVYRASENCKATFVRQVVDSAIQSSLEELAEYLPKDLREQYHLIELKQAVRILHRPKSWQELNLARYRMVFDEFLLLLLTLQGGKDMEKKTGIAHSKTENLTGQWLKQLPFLLTDAQKKVILEIKKDMERPYAMHRLLQGDVGSGKTMVAAYALLKALEGGWQGAIMAPTEILAQQHYQTLSKYLEPLGISIVLLVGSMSKQQRQDAYDGLQNGTIQIAVGTHALIQKEVCFAKLGLVVIDEQHRFGVRQQAMLEQKGNPDILVMTATPIPRSLALTVYGDLDLSIIDQLPAGRKTVKTWCITEAKREGMYQFLRQQLENHQQVYIVCPLVEESEKMDLANATVLFERLKQTVFADYSVAILHGKMKAEQKSNIMEAFRLNQIQVLVATTVIEVGVDVANATVMVVENAERFGLAQLHQLRGRVGRGSEQAYCILISAAKTEEAQRRMAAMTNYQDGFAIAEEDLALRGPGEVLGLRQHGLPGLKIANLVEDIRILEQSKLVKEAIVQEGLDEEKYRLLKAKLQRMKDQYQWQLER